MAKPTDRVERDERALVKALRAGDEDAFASLVDRYGPAMLRLAQTFVPSRAVAEEVVQEAWLGVLKGIERFEGRSSFRTWLFRILTNLAKTRGEREGRSTPYSALAADGPGGPPEPSYDPARFRPADDPAAGTWLTPPASWDEVPEERLLARETRAVIEAAIEELPPGQRTVITLRDVDGWSSEEVRNVLNVSETNQRVLLHRARTKVRRALEQYLVGG